MAKKIKSSEQQKTNPILWFLFAIGIPIVVALTLAIIILAVSGVNVTDLAKNTASHIPGVSALVSKDKSDDKEQAGPSNKELKLTIKQKNKKIAGLEETNDDLETENDDLQDKLDKQKAKQSNAKSDEQNHDVKANDKDQSKDPVKATASSFKDMQPKKAAEIFAKLSDKEAIAILQKLSNEVRGNIFEEMDSDQAATLTKKMMQSD